MKVAGTATVHFNGQKYLLRGNMNVLIGNVARESVFGIDGYHGIKETAHAAAIECDITDTSDIDWNAIEQMANVTVQVNLINGKQAILRNAYQVNELQLSVDNGQVTVRFEGPKGEWVTQPQEELT